MCGFEYVDQFEYDIDDMDLFLSNIVCKKIYRIMYYSNVFYSNATG